VIDRSRTKAHFSRSLRISFSAACLLNDFGRAPSAGVADFRHALWLPREESAIRPAAT
jgi:hypothetical protein